MSWDEANLLDFDMAIIVLQLCCYSRMAFPGWEYVFDDQVPHTWLFACPCVPIARPRLVRTPPCDDKILTKRSLAFERNRSKAAE